MSRGYTGYLTGILAAAVLLVPFVFWYLLQVAPAAGPPPKVEPAAWRFAPSSLPLQASPLGPPPHDRPLLTHVQVFDLDQDGRLDVLACDAQRLGVFWYRQTEAGQWDERPLLEPWPFGPPAHVTVVDLDQDQDLDVLVSDLGNVWPTNARVGRAVWLENLGDWRFQPQVLLDDVRRVTDVQAGDLDGDGDLDLVVAEFGFDQGRLLWLENMGGQAFRERQLMAAPGPIHVPLADYDGDGDLDIATVFTQEEEEVWGFENLGGGRFDPRPRLLYSTPNHDLGGAGLVQCDLDQDGDPDLLLSAGDNLDLVYHYPQPYHGCIWLQNLGSWRFQPRRLAHFGGTYAAAPGDLDGDGDLDVALVSIFNDWARPGAASLAWLENDGRQHFTPWQIADQPTSLCTVACGDLNGDGRADIVAGGLHIKEPFDRTGRITLWLSRHAAGSAQAGTGAQAGARP
ncbi:MAG: VCBS repeat-containing protein [Pirellulaceae bacterium]|nr:VCBS repeat-containing protein [Pirellulaceae bacterium]